MQRTDILRAGLEHMDSVVITNNFMTLLSSTSFRRN